MKIVLGIGLGHEPVPVASLAHVVCRVPVPVKHGGAHTGGDAGHAGLHVLPGDEAVSVAAAAVVQPVKGPDQLVPARGPDVDIAFAVSLLDWVGWGRGGESGGREGGQGDEGGGKLHFGWEEVGCGG